MRCKKESGSIGMNIIINTDDIFAGNITNTIHERYD